MGKDTISAILEEHGAIAAVLRSLTLLLRQGAGDEPQRFFGAMRAMLFYIDEFPERLHHPRESDLLFPSLARAVPQLMPVIRRLESDHMFGEPRVRQLQHLLTAWELLGESRRAEFESAAVDYVAFYLDHMHVEETELIPQARAALSPRQWKEIDSIFMDGHQDWVDSVPDAAYEKLFSYIVMAVPAPIGLGPELEHAAAR